MTHQKELLPAAQKVRGPTQDGHTVLLISIFGYGIAHDHRGAFGSDVLSDRFMHCTCTCVYSFTAVFQQGTDSEECLIVQRLSYKVAYAIDEEAKCPSVYRRPHIQV